jgi:hypothetical protein
LKLIRLGSTVVLSLSKHAERFVLLLMGALRQAQGCGVEKEF